MSNENKIKFTHGATIQIPSLDESARIFKGYINPSRMRRISGLSNLYDYIKKNTFKLPRKKKKAFIKKYGRLMYLSSNYFSFRHSMNQINLSALYYFDNDFIRGDENDKPVEITSIGCRV